MLGEPHQLKVETWPDKIILFDQGLGLAINLIAALLAFLLGLLFTTLSRSRQERRARSFWGGRQVSICHGSIEINPARDRTKLDLFQKRYIDGTSFPVRGPHQNVVGEGELRATNFAVAVLSEVHLTFELLSEGDAVKTLDKGSLFTIGGPNSNEATAYVLEHQQLIEFAKDGAGKISILIKANGKRFDSFDEPKKDHGVILRIKNPWNLDHYLFVCAGLGEWGTSGSVYFLWRHWVGLHAEFADSDIAVVIEVHTGSESSALRVFP